MLGSDYYSPFATVAVVTPTARYPLWVNTRELSGDYSVPQSMAYVSSVEVTTNLADLPTLNVTLTPPYGDAQAILNSPMLEHGISSLEVQFGYVDGVNNSAVMSPIYTGIMTPPQVSLGEDVSITLSATGTGAFAALRQEGGRVFNNMSRFEVMQVLVAGPTAGGSSTSRNIPRNLVLDVSAVREDRAPYFTRQVLKSQGSSKGVSLNKMFETQGVISQGYMTDWAMLWLMCWESRCTFVMQGNTIKVFPRDAWLGSKPVRLFRYRDFPTGVFEPGSGEYPVYSVECSQDSLYVSGALRGMINKSIDRSNVEVVNTIVDDATVRGTLTGSGPLGLPVSADFPGLSDTGDGGAHFTGNASEYKAVTDAAESEFQHMMETMGVQMTMTAPMDPLLHPGTVVQLAGVSLRHDHNYGVMSVTHTVGVGGAEMSVECISNTEHLYEIVYDRPAGKKNDQEADVGSSDKVQSSPSSPGD